MNSLYQFVSHVFPPSAENACSHFAITGAPFGVQRALPVRGIPSPLGVDGPGEAHQDGLAVEGVVTSNIPMLPSNLPTTGG